ncbi:unnamed protein product [Acanthosepion pharaonis]|uniref:DUF7041 domain-containing protein n=1 Tax=Acanthosepion pharaonis TaxID=158019 RepID=A0A812B2W1_ACAPH|nr:unnamed protein product [Sepia pharaonis]
MFSCSFETYGLNSTTLSLPMCEYSTLCYFNCTKTEKDIPYQTLRRLLGIASLSSLLGTTESSGHALSRVCELKCKNCPQLQFCTGEVVKDHCGCCQMCSSDLYQPHVRLTPLPNKNNACEKVKCPKFKTWFLQLDAIFQARHITSLQSKFASVVEKLPAKVVAEVADILTSLPIDKPYETLKQAILHRSGFSEERKIRDLLTNVSIGDSKPSQLLRRMQQLLGDNNISATVFRQMWLDKLPSDMVLGCINRRR